MEREKRKENSKTDGDKHNENKKDHHREEKKDKRESSRDRDRERRKRRSRSRERRRSADRGRGKDRDETHSAGQNSDKRDGRVDKEKDSRDKKNTSSRDAKDKDSGKSEETGEVGGGKEVMSLSIEETNKLRAKLGLKPLNVSTIVVEDENPNNAAMKWLQMEYDPRRDNVEYQWQWNPSLMVELEENIQSNGVKLVIMDSFATLFGGSVALNESDSGNYIYELNRIAGRTGAAIIVTHHLKKGSSVDKKSGKARPVRFDDIYGSTFIKNGASDVWGMWRSDPSGESFKLRYLKDRSMVVPRHFTYDLTGSEDTLRFEIHTAQVDTLEEGRTVKQRVLKLLEEKAGKWLSIARIHEELATASRFSSFTARAIRKACTELLDDAASTGVERQAVAPNGKGRPSYSYRCVR